MSEEEIALAETYISQFEKITHMWRWARWFLLVISISMLCSVPYLFLKAQEVQELNSKENILNESELKAEVIDKYVDVKVELLRAELTISMKMMFPILFGGVVLGYVIGGWGQEKRRKLIAKGLRAALASASGQTASNKSLNQDVQ